MPQQHPHPTGAGTGATLFAKGDVADLSSKNCDATVDSAGMAIATELGRVYELTQ